MILPLVLVARTRRTKSHLCLAGVSQSPPPSINHFPVAATASTSTATAATDCYVVCAAEAAFVAFFFTLWLCDPLILATSRRKRRAPLLLFHPLAGAFTKSILLWMMCYNAGSYAVGLRANTSAFVACRVQTPFLLCYCLLHA